MEPTADAAASAKFQQHDDSTDHGEATGPVRNVRATSGSERSTRCALPGQSPHRFFLQGLLESLGHGARHLPHLPNAKFAAAVGVTSIVNWFAATSLMKNLKHKLSRIKTDLRSEPGQNDSCWSPDLM